MDTVIIKEEIDISHDIILSFKTVTQRFYVVQALCDVRINGFTGSVFYQICVTFFKDR